MLINFVDFLKLSSLAGAITGAITTPLDVIKTRLMIQGPEKQYEGIFHCVHSILSEEGTSALFKVYARYI